VAASLAGVAAFGITLAALAQAPERGTDKLRIHLSVSSIHQALPQARLAWGRSQQLTMPHKTDPQKAAKQWAILQPMIQRRQRRIGRHRW